MSTDRKDLETLIADKREQAAVLRSHGHAAQAKSLEEFADEVAEAMRSYLTLLSDSEAMLRSGWAIGRLRGHFAEWEAAGFATLDAKGKRRYRECIVPVRANRSGARLAGARGESLRKAGGQ
jgi:hypothetical protein